MTSVLIADDHALFRNGIASLLRQHEFIVIGEASNGAEAVKLALQLCPDVVLMDFRMPVLNGIEAGKRIHREHPLIKLILLTMYNDEGELLEALRSGFSSCVIKTRSANELAHVIKEVVSGAFYLGPDIHQSVINALINNTRLPSQSLSARERYVVTLIAEGVSNAEISKNLMLSPKTVESHRSRIMKKLNFTKTSQLVCYAVRLQLIKA